MLPEPGTYNIISPAMYNTLDLCDTNDNKHIKTSTRSRVIDQLTLLNIFNETIQGLNLYFLTIEFIYIYIYMYIYFLNCGLLIVLDFFTKAWIHLGIYLCYVSFSSNYVGEHTSYKLRGIFFFFFFWCMTKRWWGGAGSALYICQLEKIKKIRPSPLANRMHCLLKSLKDTIKYEATLSQNTEIRWRSWKDKIKIKQNTLTKIKIWSVNS